MKDKIKEDRAEAIPLKMETLAAVCQLIAGLYRQRLEETTANRICCIDSADSEDDFVLGNSVCLEGLRAMQRYCEESTGEGALAVASDDFHDLFVGPHKLLAAPWSSVYLDKGGVLFGPTAMEVKDAFSREGFAIPEGGAEPSDHVAYEWQFLADIQKRAASQLADGHKTEGCESVLLAKDFCDRYLSTWMDAFCERVSANSRTDFYKGLSMFTLGVLALERSLLKDAQECLYEQGKGGNKCYSRNGE